MNPLLQGLGTLLTSAVVAAIVTWAQNSWMERGRARAAELARLQTAFAEAFKTYAQYKEYPYAIRRRRLDQPESERVRLSEEIRQTQARLSYHEAWTLFEDPNAGLAYADLVRQVRVIAGEAMKAAWQDDPVQDDAGMVIPGSIINLKPLTEHEDRYVAAVEERLRSLRPHHLRQGSLKAAKPRTSMLPLRAAPTLPETSSATDERSDGRPGDR